MDHVQYHGMEVAVHTQQAVVVDIHWYPDQEREHQNVVKIVELQQMQHVQYHGMEVAVYTQQVVIVDIH